MNRKWKNGGMCYKRDTNSDFLSLFEKSKNGQLLAGCWMQARPWLMYEQTASIVIGVNVHNALCFCLNFLFTLAKPLYDNFCYCSIIFIKTTITLIKVVMGYSCVICDPVCLCVFARAIGNQQSVMAYILAMCKLKMPVFVNENTKTLILLITKWTYSFRFDKHFIIIHHPPFIIICS